MIFLNDSQRPHHSRRPAEMPVVQNISIGSTFNRRPSPSRPQFSGFVEIGEVGVKGRRLVQLKLRSGMILEQVWSNETTGYFAFTRWYPPRDDYEVHVVGDNYVNTSFPTLAPFEVTWRGNPQIRSSDSGPPPPWAPDQLEITPLSQISSVFVEGESITWEFKTWNAIAPLVWTLTGNPPPGVSINPGTGTVTGTLSSLGVFDFAIEVSDSAGRSMSLPLTIEVTDVLPLYELVIRDAPIHYWRLNDTGGTVLTAAMGLNGFYVGSPPLGQAPLYPRGDVSLLAGPGGAAQYGQISNPLPTVMNEFSLLCVVKFQTISGFRGLVSADSSGRKWQWRMEGNTIQFVKIAGGVSTVSGGSLVPGEVAVIALTVSASGELRMYKNGELMSTTSLSAANYGGGTDIQIGYMSGGGGAAADAFFSDAAIFDKVLSAERIEEYAVGANLHFSE